MMTSVLARVIAQGTDETTPSYIHAGRMMMRPLVKSGIVSFSRFMPEEHQCHDCSGCDEGPNVKRIFDRKSGTWRHHLSCPETTEFIPDELVSAYSIDMDAFFGIISSSFGCGKPNAIPEVDGAWDFGMSGVIKAKHSRRVVFIRRLEHYSAVQLNANSTYGDGIILIAASLDRRVREEGLLTAIALNETLGYDDGILSFDMHPVTERFKLRTAELAKQKAMNKEPPKPTRDRIRALADYLKMRAVNILSMYSMELKIFHGHENLLDSKSAHDATNDAMKAVTVEAVSRDFDGSSKEWPKMGVSTIYNYLDEDKYPHLAEASAARHRWAVCTRREMMQITSLILRKEMKQRVEVSSHEMDGVGLWEFVNRKLESYGHRIKTGELSLYE